jgi:glycosyltransferase involved in cell wall biosynthesis
MSGPHSGDGSKVLLVTPVTPWRAFGGTAIASRNIIQLLSQVLDVHVCCLRSDEPGYADQRADLSVLSGRVSGFQRKLRAILDQRADSFAHRQFQRDIVVSRFSELVEDMRPRFVIFDHIYSSWLVDCIRDEQAMVCYIAHDDMVAYADSLIAMNPGLFDRIRFQWLRTQYCHLQERILRRCGYVLTLTKEDASRLKGHRIAAETEIFPIFIDGPQNSRTYSERFANLLVTGSFDTWEKQEGLSIFMNHIFMPLLKMCADLQLVIAGRLSRSFRRTLPSMRQLRVVDSPSESLMRELFHEASAAAVLDLQSSGLKIKTMELAGAGLPIVSWAPGLEGTRLVDGKSCLLAASVDEFVSHLATLFHDPGIRRALGSEARAIVETQFSRNNAKRSLTDLKFFRQLAEAGSVRGNAL